MSAIQIKRGSVRVKIYSVPVGSRARWEVRYKFGGRIHRLKRATKKAALLLAEQKAARIADGRTYLDRLTDRDAWEWERCQQLASEFGLTPYDLVLEAANTRRNKPARQSPQVADVVEQFLRAKTAQSLSPYYLRAFKTRLTRFGADFRVPIDQVRAPHLTDWMAGLKKIVRTRSGPKQTGAIGPRTWNNYRADLAALFAFAKLRKFLPADWSEIEQIGPVKIRRTRILVFTVAEMQDMLSAAPDRLRPALALGAFAGLRSEEIQRLRWELINWEEGYIRVPKDITKTGRARDVPLVDNLRQWLKPWCETGAGPVCDYANLSVGKTNLARKLGRAWKRNGLRHSFISYRLAAVKSEAQVALEAGNSPGIINSVYKDLVRPSDARKWFEIRPLNVPSGILQLRFA
jgi:integrase